MKLTLNTSSSFRGITKTCEIIKDCSNMTIQSPTHTTILNWIHKLGLAQISKPKPKANDWIIILDHSIAIGKEKVLVVLGIRESEVDFTKPLKYQNLYTILEEARDHWDGEGVREILEKVKAELGRIKYAIADYGPDLRKGLRLSGINHVYDLTHKIASLLKVIYKNNEEFISFSKKMVKSRIQSQQTSVAHLIPPSMRTKSRFENIGAISDWSNKILKYLTNIPKQDSDIKEKAIEKFGWVLEYKKLIIELSEINLAMRDFQKKIKTHGIITKEQIKQLSPLKKMKTKNGKWLMENLKEYMSATISLIRNKVTPILCSSDIIESAFGKYKNFVSSNPMAGITNLVLCIAAFTAPLDEEEIISCLEMFTIQDVKDWTKKYLKESLYKKRKAALCK